MDKKSARELAPEQLERVLGFFARVEAKASFVFAINSALLGVLAVNVHKIDFQTFWNCASLLVASALLALSFYFVYRCSFPNLKGGHSSLVYFGEISKMREQEYLKAFHKASVDEIADDLLAQTWRNAQILTKKFDAIKIAFILTGLALVPWVAFLVLASISHPQLPAAK